MNNLPVKLLKGTGPFDVARKIRLASSSVQKLHDAISQLKAMSGVVDADVNESNVLSISYDASTVGFVDIESALDAAGIARRAGYWPHFKSMWYGYLDGNIKSTANSSGGACCNRPPSPFGKKK